MAGSNTNVTYQGTGFAGGGPAPNVTIDLEPSGAPIVIPPGGGNFDFNATMVNGETTSQTFGVWIMVQLPNMTWFDRLSGRSP